MALERRLESERFPYLPLQVQASSHSLDVEALVDTGFDGDVALPRSLISGQMIPDHYAAWTLADGSEVLAAVFIGAARLGTFRPFPVLITVIGDEPLVGRGAIDRFRLTLDHGRRLIVED